MLKVLRITTILDFGGIEKRLINTAKYLDNDVEFVFVSLGKGGWAEGEIKALNKRVILLQSRFRIPKPGLILKLIRLIRRERPDVVHTSGAEANFHGILAARVCGTKRIVAEEIGFPVHSSRAKKVFRFVYSFAHNVIAISEAVKNAMITLGEVRPDRIKVIYNPVIEPVLTNQRNYGPSVFKLLMVSRLEYAKNLHSVIEVLGKYRNDLPPFTLTVVGEGSQRAVLEAKVKELGLDDLVQFTGFRGDTGRYYESSDIFLIPSYAEGLSNSLLEAMTYEMVCIATDVGGPRELIEADVNGFFFHPTDLLSIKNALLKVMNLPPTVREQVGKNARRMALEKYSLETYVGNLVGVYQSESRF